MLNLGKLVSELYRLARVLNDFNTLTSANPGKIVRRYRNKLVGRRAGKMSKW